MFTAALEYCMVKKAVYLFVNGMIEIYRRSGDRQPVRRSQRRRTEPEFLNCCKKIYLQHSHNYVGTKKIPVQPYSCTGKNTVCFILLFHYYLRMHHLPVVGI